VVGALVVVLLWFVFDMAGDLSPDRTAPVPQLASSPASMVTTATFPTRLTVPAVFCNRVLRIGAMSGLGLSR
jgi:hypothetical protein